MSGDTAGTPADRARSWSVLETEAPELAREGASLLAVRPGAFLVTVRGLDAPPRIHPVSVAILEGRLLTFVLASPKRTDLELDGRFALHAAQNAAVPNEFSCRGWATPVDDPAVVAATAAVWRFEPDETFRLFELRLQTAVLGRRPGPDAWPPEYTTWRSR